MFAKCALRAESRGIRPAQSYMRAKNRLEQWISGERASLWREVAIEDERVRKRVNVRVGSHLRRGS